MRKLFIIAVALLLAGCAATPGDPPTPTALPAAAQPTQAALSDGSIRAEGRLVPIRSAALSMPSAGLVAELAVAEGEQVRAGQVLLRLNSSRALTMAAQAEAELARAQAAYALLGGNAAPDQVAVAEADLRAAQAQLRQIEGGVTSADRAAAQARLAQARARLAELQAGPRSTDLQAAKAQLAQAEANLTTQRDQLSAAKTTAQLTVQQRVSELTSAQAAYASAKRNWEYVQETGRDPNATIDPATGKRVHPRLDDRQTQQYYDVFVQAEAAMRSAEAALAQAQVAADTARQAEVSGIRAAEQQVAQAQAALDRLLAGADAAALAGARAEMAQAQAALDKLAGAQRTGALDAAQAAVDQAQARLDRLRAGAAQGELAVAEAEVQRAQAALKLAQVAVAEAELRAPFAGTVGALSVRVGEYVAPGMPVVQLADLSAWLVETTDLTERNVARVQVGNPASVTLDALPELELRGAVSHIRLLGENRQGEITYAVTIELQQPDPRLRWNMTAAVAIDTGAS